MNGPNTKVSMAQDGLDWDDAEERTREYSSVDMAVWDDDTIIADHKDLMVALRACRQLSEEQNKTLPRLQLLPDPPEELLWTAETPVIVHRTRRRRRYGRSHLVVALISAGVCLLLSAATILLARSIDSDVSRSVNAAQPSD